MKVGLTLGPNNVFVGSNFSREQNSLNSTLLEDYFRPYIVFKRPIEENLINRGTLPQPQPQPWFSRSIVRLSVCL